MSFIIRNTVNRSIFGLLRSSFPLASYCALERSAETLRSQRTYTAFSVSSTTLHNNQHQLVRWKSKKSSRKDQSRREQDEDSEDDDEHKLDDFDELLTDKTTKLIKTSVSSMRADLILKAGLGVARNKVETLFYESKIRVNGRKLLKKSAQLDVGDEVDIVKGPSPTNPEHLIVARVEILAATSKSESIGISLRRHKSMIIENYENDAVIGDK